MKRLSTKRPSKRLAKADYETLAQFRYLLRSFLSFSEEAAREAGLTAQQHQALLAIHGFPGRERVLVGELAQRLHSRHHSVVGLVDRLCAKALVRRRHDPLDRRRVLIELTPQGRSLLRRLSVTHRNELRRLAPLLIRLLAQVEPGLTTANLGETP
jgi:DNA-binding MarR family transcriptional regulator